MLINVLDKTSVQQAFDDARAGDRLYFPTKRVGGLPAVYQAPPGGWTIDKSLELFGDGTGSIENDTGTTIKPAAPGGGINSDTVFNIAAADGSYVYIHDMKIRGSGIANATTADQTIAGIRCVSYITTKNLRLDRVGVIDTGSHGLYLGGTGGPSLKTVSIRDCNFNGNAGCGAHLDDIQSIYLFGTECAANHQHGVRASGVQDLQLLGCWFENNWNATGEIPDPSPLQVEIDTQVYLQGCNGFIVTGCHFEGFNIQNHARFTALSIDGCRGGVVDACEFVNLAAIVSTRGILMFTSNPLATVGTTDVMVGMNDFALVDTSVQLDIATQPSVAHCSNCTLFPQNVRNTTVTLLAKMIIPDIDDGGNYVHIPAGYASNVGVGVAFPSIAAVPTRQNIPVDATNSAASYLRRGLVVYQGKSASGGTILGDSADRLTVYSGDSVSTSPRRGYGWQSLIPKVGIDQDLIGQTSAITTARNLLDVCPAGPYRLSLVATCRAVSANATRMQVTVNWLDLGGRARTLLLGGELILSAAGACVFADANIEVGTGYAVSFVTSLAGGAIGSGSYDLRMRFEAL